MVTNHNWVVGLNMFELVLLYQKSDDPNDDEHIFSRFLTTK